MSSSIETISDRDIMYVIDKKSKVVVSSYVL